MLKKLFVVLAVVTAVAAQQPRKSNTATPASAPSGTIVLKGGKLLTMTHGVIENGVVVMQNGKNVFIKNSVTVTVTYQWIPEVFGVGVTLTSTSTMPMSF